MWVRQRWREGDRGLIIPGRNERAQGVSTVQQSACAGTLAAVFTSGLASFLCFMSL